MSAPLRVLLADDQPLIRAGFSAILGSAADLAIVGEARTGTEAVQAVRRLVPDVVLMDVRMPELDGIEATRQIAADPALAAVRVLVVTTFELDEYVLRALRAGASGFVSKGIEPAELVAAVRTVAAGESLLSPAATRALIGHFRQQPGTGPPAPAPGPALDLLTDREREVVVLVAQGLSNEDIGRRLFVSPLTAKTHVNRAMSKLAARDRAQLVVYAYTHGLLRPQ